MDFLTSFTCREITIATTDYYNNNFLTSLHEKGPKFLESVQN